MQCEVLLRTSVNRSIVHLPFDEQAMSESISANSTLPIVARCARYATVLLLLAMFIGTHLPSQSMPGFGFSDKLLHFLAYFALGFSALVSWELSVGVLRPSHYLAVWVTGAIYGAVDEITQTPFGRTCDWTDWLADLAGLLVGVIAFHVLRPMIYRLPFLSLPQ